MASEPNFTKHRKVGDSMFIRSITPSDYPATKELIVAAFQQSEHGYQGEAQIVEKIRQETTYEPELEMVAEVDGKLLGHGLLSPVKIVNEQRTFTGLVLAPLAVLPEFQGQGIGGKLLQELEKQAAKQSYPFISILGHPDYYPRFGYQKASLYNITAPFSVPDEAFLIKALTPEGLVGVSGVVRYSKAFD